MSITNTNPTFEERVKANGFMCCDGFGCNRKAIEIIDVSAGIFGNVSLKLCPNCIKLFENHAGRSLK